MGVSTWLAIVGTAWAIVCAVLAWVFATGRWTQRHEQAHKDHVAKFAEIERQFEAVQQLIAQVRREVESGLAAAEAESKRRHDLVERVNVTMGKLSSRLNILYREIALRVEHGNREIAEIKRQLERTDDYARSLQRQIDKQP